jgi:integrase
MGTVFKKITTRAMPEDAEVFTRKGERLARWKAGRKVKTAPVTGSGRIRTESSTYYCRYRDGSGLVVEVATGCKTEDAARQWLARLERDSERVRAGLISPAEARTAEHLATPIGDHVEAFVSALEAAGRSAQHVYESRRVLTVSLAGCGFGPLASLDRSAVEAWLNRRRLDGASARTRNADLATLVAFCNWLVSVGRLTHNPLARVPKANQEADRRRVRRAMTGEELAKLLDVARTRPVQDALRVRQGPRKGEAYRTLRPEVRAGLEAVGRERALIYRTLVLTGLRKGELAALTVGNLSLDGPSPCLTLAAAHEKNRQGSTLPLRPDLAADLRGWLADKLSAVQGEARRRGEPIPARLDPAAPVFDVPVRLSAILARDLKAAGIAAKDERGRVLDVYALRTTFGSMLARAGVPLTTAQRLMRHSDPKLTAVTYTDPKLLDMAGAVEALPALPLNAGGECRHLQAGE